MATQPGRSRSTRGTGRSTDFDTAEVASTGTAETPHADAGNAGETNRATGDAAGGQSSQSNGQQGWTGVLKNAASSRISSQKHQASESIGQVARALRDTTDRMQDQGSATVAGYARQAAEQLERFSRRLDEQDLDEMLRGAQRLARTRPWVFVGAAFGLGVVAARFFKSSSATEPAHQDDRWESVGGTTFTPPPTEPSLGSTSPYGLGPTS
jgi:hypothetical protein